MHSETELSPHQDRNTRLPFELLTSKIESPLCFETCDQRKNVGESCDIVPIFAESGGISNSMLAGMAHRTFLETRQVFLKTGELETGILLATVFAKYPMFILYKRYPFHHVIVPERCCIPS